MTPYGTVDGAATFILVALAVAAAALAALAFRYRDVGSPLFSLPVSGRPESYEPSLSRVWRIPVVRDLWDRRVRLLVWAVGLSALGAVFVVLPKSLVHPLLPIPPLPRHSSPFV